jgi:hypothetical protein
MLAILKSASLALQGNREVQRFLEQVDDDFAHVTSTPRTRDYLPGEDVFWWCHMTLYELTDIVRPPLRPDPWIRHLIEELRAMSGRLERGERLPDTHQVGWFDDTEALDEELEDLDEELDEELGEEER